MQFSELWLEREFPILFSLMLTTHKSVIKFIERNASHTKIQIV